MRGKNIFKFIGAVDMTNFLDPQKYKEWEMRVAEAAIALHKGWEVKLWWTISLEPLARGVVIKSHLGEERHYYCLPLKAK
jgi:hypothetical protein